MVALIPERSHQQGHRTRQGCIGGRPGTVGYNVEGNKRRNDNLPSPTAVQPS
jgi:hypothetical protein